MNRIAQAPLPAAALTAIGRGFAQPVHAAQQVFRTVLEAMSRPGRLQRLPAAALDGLESPALSRGLCAVLLTLLDAETSVWLDPALAPPVAADYLRFHSGVRVLADERGAAFVVVAAAQAQPALWTRLDDGSDEVPQAGATLIVEVPLLAATAAAPQALPLRLRGPGIAASEVLAVGGLAAPFWQARAATEAAFPRGIDLILCCGDSVAALPRTTRVSLEG